MTASPGPDIMPPAAADARTTVTERFIQALLQDVRRADPPITNAEALEVVLRDSVDRHVAALRPGVTFLVDPRTVHALPWRVVDYRGRGRIWDAAGEWHGDHDLDVATLIVDAVNLRLCDAEEASR